MAGCGELRSIFILFRFSYFIQSAKCEAHQEKFWHSSRARLSTRCAIIPRHPFPTKFSWKELLFGQCNWYRRKAKSFGMLKGYYPSMRNRSTSLQDRKVGDHFKTRNSFVQTVFRPVWGTERHHEILSAVACWVSITFDLNHSLRLCVMLLCWFYPSILGSRTSEGANGTFSSRRSVSLFDSSNLTGMQI